MSDALSLGGLIGPLGTIILYLFARVAEIANQRRTDYAKAVVKLVDLWRTGDSAKKGELLAELAGLCVDSNPDIYNHIEAFADSVISNSSDAAAKLVALVEQMRTTSALGEVRHRFVGGGLSRAALFKKLIEF